ncbi:MAG: hypothetical protein M5U26_22000 [Planctomycetota bacterium]|nr:hypothetical protein [Planctomycetota bacterium]
MAYYALFLAIWTAVQSQSVYWLYRRVWPELKGAGYRFQFHILDLWAALFGLAPTMALFGYVYFRIGLPGEPRILPHLLAVWTLAVVVLSQLAGSLWASVDLRGKNQNPDTFSLAVTILAYSFMSVVFAGTMGLLSLPILWAASWLLWTLGIL